MPFVRCGCNVLYAGIVYIVLTVIQKRLARLFLCCHNLHSERFGTYRLFIFRLVCHILESGQGNFINRLYPCPLCVHGCGLVRSAHACHNLIFIGIGYLRVVFFQLFQCHFFILLAVFCIGFIIMAIGIA